MRRADRHGSAPETVDSEEIRKVLEKVDKESTHRELHGWQGWAIAVLAVAFSGFHIYTALFGVLDAHLQRAVHLGFVLTLVYLLYPASRRACGATASTRWTCCSWPLRSSASATCWSTTAPS